MASNIFYGNQYVGKVHYNSRFKRFMAHLVHKTKLALSLIAIVSLTGWAILAGAHLFPEIAYADRVVEVSKPLEIPVLEKIAKCESGGNHYSKDGQVARNANPNGSVDIGRYQINLKVWGQTASNMQLDLTKEEDNRKFAEYLYLNYGTEPWYSSKSCWSK